MEYYNSDSVDNGLFLDQRPKSYFTMKTNFQKLE